MRLLTSLRSGPRTFLLDQLVQEFGGFFSFWDSLPPAASGRLPLRHLPPRPPPRRRLLRLLRQRLRRRGGASLALQRAQARPGAFCRRALRRRFPVPLLQVALRLLARLL